jgi:hypothetical protein
VNVPTDVVPGAMMPLALTTSALLERVPVPASVPVVTVVVPLNVLVPVSV